MYPPRSSSVSARTPFPSSTSGSVSVFRTSWEIRWGSNTWTPNRRAIRPAVRYPYFEPLGKYVGGRTLGRPIGARSDPAAAGGVQREIPRGRELSDRARADGRDSEAGASRAGDS